MNSTFEKIMEVTKRILEVDEIEVLKSDSLAELGLNSITFVKIVVEIEKELDIEFDDDYLDFEKYSTVNEFCRYVDSLVKNK